MNFTKLNPNAEGAERRRTDQRVGEVTSGAGVTASPETKVAGSLPDELRGCRVASERLTNKPAQLLESFWDIAPDEAHAFWVNDIYSDNYETEKEN